jgi:hypothetical protein
MGYTVYKNQYHYGLQYFYKIPINITHGMMLYKCKQDPTKCHIKHRIYLGIPFSERLYYHTILDPNSNYEYLSFIRRLIKFTKEEWELFHIQDILLNGSNL